MIDFECQAVLHFAAVVAMRRFSVFAAVIAASVDLIVAWDASAVGVSPYHPPNGSECNVKLKRVRCFDLWPRSLQEGLFTVPFVPSNPRTSYIINIVPLMVR